jgi:hypothetical protein
MGSRDFKWAEDVAIRRGWSKDGLARGKVGLRLGGAVGGRAWQCDIEQDRNLEGAPNHSVVWTCPMVTAPGPGVRLAVHENAGVSLGSTGTAIDVAIAAGALVKGLIRRSRQPTMPTVADIRSLLSIEDPEGIFTGEIEQRYLHWPIPAAVDNPLARGLRSLDAIVDKNPARPADAPSTTLVLRCDPTQPLMCSCPATWNRPDWLEHQIDLACAVASALSP